METLTTAKQPSLKTITDRNLDEFPPQVREAYLALKEKRFDELMPVKYYKVQRTRIAEELRKLHEKRPDLSPLAVVKRALADLPDFIPADKIIELTRFTLHTWQKMKKEAEMVAA